MRLLVSLLLCSAAWGQIPLGGITGGAGAPATNPPTIVHSDSQESGSGLTTTTFTLPYTITAGTGRVLVIAATQTASSITGNLTVSDSLGNTWTCLNSAPASATATICRAPITTGGAGDVISVVSAGGATFVQESSFELSGVGSGVTDGTNTCTATGTCQASNSYDTHSVTTTVATDLLIAASVCASSTTFATASGWTPSDRCAGGTFLCHQWRTTSSTGTFSATAAIGSLLDTGNVIVAFKGQ